MTTRTISSLGHYEGEIQRRFIESHCGLQLEKLGQKRISKVCPVDLSSIQLIKNSKGLLDEMTEIIDFVQSQYKSNGIRPIWYKINVTDQAVNEYVGVGFLNVEEGWVSFILNYLSIDRADQSGDTIIALFDTELKWATSFTLSQDDERLMIDLYKN